jgi:hypothetical protein
MNATEKMTVPGTTASDPKEPRGDATRLVAGVRVRTRPL